MSLSKETLDELVTAVARFVKERLVPIEAQVAEDDKVPDEWLPPAKAPESANYETLPNTVRQAWNQFPGAFNGNGHGDAEFAVRAAAVNLYQSLGMPIVNASFGGRYTNVVAQAIANYPNTLFVVAAGNNGIDTASDDQAYPCRLPYANAENTMTYRTRDGRQFVLASTGAGTDASLVAFALQ